MAEKKAGKKKNRAVRVILGILAALVLIVGGYLIYVFAAYHRIEDNQVLDVEKGEASAVCEVGKEYNVLTYNIGFGAYSQDFSFFMDGGKSSWAESEESVDLNVTGAALLARSLDPEIVLFQEIDVDGTRSYHVNEKEMIDEIIPEYTNVFAVNYDSPFLMYPPTEPHGKNYAGIGTYTMFDIASSLRRSLPISDSLSKLVDLDRCYSVSRIPVENGKELVVINVHLSAYGNSDEVREGQKNMLKEDMAKEVAAGNYVIVGGDFNHDLIAPEDQTDAASWAYPYPRSYLPEGMHFCLDLLTEEERNGFRPTCRNANEPYDPETREQFVIDGFIISDNIEQISYQTVENEYLYSDHNPVELVFRLK
ncbi:MAG: endonuclease/exonuclease/phosphatase family protein [Lachnospiraceae bacterium]|nr:endonuclease/exonuclease/phosphatase family protein [Lachnospiraceae bacterium]